jgi:dTDP-4-dehydrorhamnose reductase
MMKVVVTGAAGQLGSAIAKTFGPAHDVVACAFAQLDITSPDSVARLIAAERPDLIVNCAAYNDVDGCEDEAATALDVNAFGVLSLARAAARAGAVLVHYSTDFVFAGDADRPYTEDDPPGPRSFYALSKLLGEWFAREAPRWYLLRVESLFGGSALGSSHRSSVDRIADAMFEGRDAVVFSDRTVSPSFVVDVARATRDVVERGVPYGLYHCVNSGSCTWYDLAREMARQAGIEARLQPRPCADVPLRAARPVYSPLSNAKLAAAGIVMPGWQDAISRYLAIRTQGQS